MGHFLEVARRVLIHSKRSLSAREITNIAMEKGWLTTGGLTPWQTMKSKLSTDILKRKERSLFMRTEQAHFALREWKKGGEIEYVAERYRKALLDEEIMVVPSEVLGSFVSGSGIYEGDLGDGRELVAATFPMSRRDAEVDERVIQLVSAFLLTWKGRILTHKRTRRLPESRLHGYYSLFFGGHLNPGDLPTLFNFSEASYGFNFLSRELEEEVILPKSQPPEFRYLGLIYDDSQPVSRQHLGIVYQVRLQTDEFRIGERGFLMDPKFEEPEAIAERLGEFENWSQMILCFLVGHQGDLGL